MWLQRVLFNMQTRLLGRYDPPSSTAETPKCPSRRLKKERKQLFQDRLLDLDRRLAQLKTTN